MTAPIVWTDIVAMYEKIVFDHRAPRASVLWCGRDVPDLLIQRISGGVTYPADPLSMGVNHLAGIPLVMKPELAPDQWKLIDQYGEVLRVGSIA